MLEALQPPAGEKGKPEKLLKRLRAEGRDALLDEEIRMRKAADLLVEGASQCRLPMPSPAPARPPSRGAVDAGGRGRPRGRR